MLLKKPEELSEELELKVQVGSAVPPIIVDHSESVVSAYQQNICATDDEENWHRKRLTRTRTTKWARENDARVTAGKNLGKSVGVVD